MTFDNLPPDVAIMVASLKPIAYSELDAAHRNMLTIKVDRLSNKIYSNPVSCRNRTYDQVENDVTIGIFGEVGISYRLHTIPQVEQSRVNVEEVSQEYHWDVEAIVDAKRWLFECKFQSHADGLRTFLSFDDQLKASTAIEKWKLWSFMVGFHTHTEENDFWVVPTSITMNTAFDPNKSLYVDSGFKGKYLKEGVARGQGLHLKLNEGWHPSNN
jgi:hypothetical protein